MLPSALHGRWSGEQPEYVAGNPIGYEDSPTGIVNVFRHVVQMISGSIVSLRRATAKGDPHAVVSMVAPLLLETLTSPCIIESAFIVDDGNTMVAVTSAVLRVRVTTHSARSAATTSSAVPTSTRRTMARSTGRSASGGPVTPASSHRIWRLVLATVPTRSAASSATRRPAAKPSTTSWCRMSST